MNYNEAIALAASGSKVTRPSWGTDYVENRYCMPELRLMNKHPHKVSGYIVIPFCPTSGDLSANDYVTV